MKGTAAPTRSTCTGDKGSHRRARRDRRVILFVFLCVFCVLCGATAAAQSFSIPESKLLDLTHPFDAATVYWPTAQPFRWEKESWGPSPGGYFYAAGRFQMSEHVGTHLDSPIHFAEHQRTTDQIPLPQLVGPAFRVDVTAACAAHSDYQVTAADLAAFEKRHGPVPAGAMVLIYTGWSQRWPDRKRYLGSDAAGDTANLHFPGIARDGAEWLAARKVDAVGIDTASLDHGPSRDFIAHRILAAANIYGLENVANLDKAPARGATVIALPMLIRGSSGAPVRILAILP
jgi:kynurenine formamidase